VSRTKDAEQSRPSTLCVMGGRQRSARSALDFDKDWYGYGSGVAALLEGDTVASTFSYVSPPSACLPSDPILFKTGTLVGHLLYVPTQTEVLVLSLPDFAVRHRISLPCFNDVHHVVPAGPDSVYVVNTGLDMVLEVRLDATVVQTWNVLGEEPWSRFDPHKDYRFGCSTKPHVAHPNFLFLIDGEPFVTRFELRDAVSLHDQRRRILIADERAHDGVVRDGLVYFTTVDGRLVVADAATLQVLDQVRLDPEPWGAGALGWCRGLLLDGEHCWVGFTRIRPTRFRSALSWARSGRVTAPTRLGRFRLADGELVTEIDLEPAGINAIFGMGAA